MISLQLAIHRSITRQLTTRLLPCVILVLFSPAGTTRAEPLEVEHYRKSCPAAESMCAPPSRRASRATRPSQRHCSGSTSTAAVPRANVAEKDAMPNQSLDGFYVIDAAKEALELERACPSVVSCVDIVALAARDAVSLAPGRSTYGAGVWELPTGRLDGRVSMASEALANLPSSYADFAQLKELFGLKGLNAKDLAILSGAHAIGNSHCISFARRLCNFTGNGGIDPTLDPIYAKPLHAKCPPQYDNTTTVEVVPGSSTTFDTE